MIRTPLLPDATAQSLAHGTFRIRFVVVSSFLLLLITSCLLIPYGTIVSAGSINLTSEGSAAQTSSPQHIDPQIIENVAGLKVDATKDTEDSLNFDAREHLNIVFIGHVDAGKSTISGQILVLAGMVDKRTLEKYEKEAKEKNRESWYMAYVMDTDESEREKGKTVDVGSACFETAKKRYTVLDAPGHKNYVPNMIAGTAQADVGVLVISARTGEFEAGFERGGQTREHAQLAKTLGVSKVVVVVNKMDFVSWDKGRYDDIVTKLTPFLKKCGYNTDKDVIFLPVSGQKGSNIKDKVAAEECSWYQGRSLLDTLDDLETFAWDPNQPFRMPVSSRYREGSGTNVLGKTEAGIVRLGDKLIVMPSKKLVQVEQLWRDEVETNKVLPGENVRIFLRGLDDNDVWEGSVLSSQTDPARCTDEFECQMQLIDIPAHKGIFTAGYESMLHVHSLTVPCIVVKISGELDRRTGNISKKTPFLRVGALARVRIKTGSKICVEKFSTYPKLGRFTLRDEGTTIAIGKIVRTKSDKA